MDFLRPMDDRESLIVGQKCNYSSLEFCVRRGDLLQYFDLEWVVLDFFELVIPIVSKWIISRSPRSILQGLSANCIAISSIIFSPKHFSIHLFLLGPNDFQTSLKSFSVQGSTPRSC